MANIKISDLTAVTAPATTDVVPIVNAGATKKVSIANLVTVVKPDISCRLQFTADQNSVSGTSLFLNWDVENFDTDTMHDPTTNPGRITIKTAGKYVVAFSLTCQSTNTTGRRQGEIVLNHTTGLANAAVPGANIASGLVLNAATIINLIVGDFLEVAFYQDSTVNLAVLGVTTANLQLAMPQFNAIKIA